MVEVNKNGLMLFLTSAEEIGEDAFVEVSGSTIWIGVSDTINAFAISVEFFIGGNFGEGGVYGVPIGKLATMVKMLSGEHIDIQFDDKSVVVSDNSNTFTIACFHEKAIKKSPKRDSFGKVQGKCKLTVTECPVFCKRAIEILKSGRSVAGAKTTDAFPVTIIGRETPPSMELSFSDDGGVLRGASFGVPVSTVEIAERDKTACLFSSDYLLRALKVMSAFDMVVLDFHTQYPLSLRGAGTNIFAHVLLAPRITEE